MTIANSAPPAVTPPSPRHRTLLHTGNIFRQSASFMHLSGCCRVLQPSTPLRARHTSQCHTSQPLRHPAWRRRQGLPPPPIVKPLDWYGPQSRIVTPYTRTPSPQLHDTIAARLSHSRPSPPRNPAQVFTAYHFAIVQDLKPSFIRSNDRHACISPAR